MNVRVARQLLDSFTAFDEATSSDPKFKSVCETLHGVEQQIEKLVPALADRVPDESDPAKTYDEAALKAKKLMQDKAPGSNAYSAKEK